jgi:hypothetical protein
MLVAEVVNLDAGNTVVGTARFTLSLLNTNPKFKIETYLGEVPTGILVLNEFSYSVKNTFLDFIHSGVEISPIYAIDFSESSGHTSTRLDENLYLKPIKELQNILQHYHLDPLYPVLGTGALFPNMSKPSYYFALTGNIFQPEIPTHTMLQDYYKSTLTSIFPANQTKYSEIIESTIKYVQHELSDTQKYYILIIISAGDPIDTEQILTFFPIVAELPLSIINIRVPHDLIICENLEKLKNPYPRSFFDAFEHDEINKVLEKIKEHMMEYAIYKSLNVAKRAERSRMPRSSTLKVSPEKFKFRSNYFTKCKGEYIEFLKKIGHTQDKIDEVSNIGVPFLLMDGSPNVSLPMRNRTRTTRQRSIVNMEASCLNCNRMVSKLEESPCGCKYFCVECIDKSSCPECTNREKLS